MKHLLTLVLLTAFTTTAQRQWKVVNEITAENDSASLDSSYMVEIAPDPDWSDFATTYGITGDEYTASDNITKALKGNNVLGKDFWSDALYLNYVSAKDYSTSKRAIVPGNGKAQATDIGTGQTHGEDGIGLNGTSNGLNIGGITDGVKKDRLVFAHVRTNTISVSGVSFGNSGGAQFYARAASGNSGFFTPYEYAGYPFDVRGIYIGHNNGTTYGLMKDRVWQTTSSNTTPSSSTIANGDFYVGCRLHSGSASNFVDETVGGIFVFDAGSAAYTETELQVLSDIIYQYSVAMNRAPVTKPAVIIDGNSLANEADDSLKVWFDNRYGSTNYDYFNIAVDGEDLTDLIARFDKSTKPLMGGYRSRVIYAVNETRNEIKNNGSTAQETYDLAIDLCEDAKDVGPNVKTVYTQCPASGEGGGSTTLIEEIDTVNSMLASYSGADIDLIVDIQNSYCFDAITSACYQSDYVHLSDAGYGWFAIRWTGTINIKYP